MRIKTLLLASLSIVGLSTFTAPADANAGDTLNIVNQWRGVGVLTYTCGRVALIKDLGALTATVNFSQGRSVFTRPVTCLTQETFMVDVGNPSIKKTFTLNSQMNTIAVDPNGVATAYRASAGTSSE